MKPNSKEIKDILKIFLRYKVELDKQKHNIESHPKEPKQVTKPPYDRIPSKQDIIQRKKTS